MLSYRDRLHCDLPSLPALIYDIAFRVVQSWIKTLKKVISDTEIIKEVKSEIAEERRKVDQAFGRRKFQEELDPVKEFQ